MKKLLSVSVIILFILIVFSAIMPQENEQKFNNNDYIRIHVRAASNTTYDQKVKLAVKDSLVNYLTEKFNGITNKAQAETFIKQNISSIEEVCNLAIKNAGANYSCQISLKKEYFPDKNYGEMNFPSGIYEALIVSIDGGNGDNWWCVAYPPLCFLNSEPNPNNPNKITYKSFIAEFFNKLINNDK